MRKTYRNQTSFDYWKSRWESVEADAPMQNTKKYPLICALKILEGCQVEKTRILEAGCGTGRLLRHFHQKGFNIIGIDFIPNAIEKILSLNGNLQAEVGDITNLKFDDNTFTHILAFGLYHNFEIDIMKSALVETSRVLQEGGTLCASFRADNLENSLNDRFFSSGLGSRFKSNVQNNRIFHKINLTYEEVAKVVENAGFEVTRIYEIENMPLLYKIKLFRHQSHKIFDENLARTDGYVLNSLGQYITNFLKKFFPKQFCNLYVVEAKKISEQRKKNQV